jgi:Family of unknown function (DUF5999)
MNCSHQPPCPRADAPDREAAHVMSAHPEQGWSLLCNGVVMFEDTGDLLPDGRVIPPHRGGDDEAPWNGGTPDSRGPLVTAHEPPGPV